MPEENNTVSCEATASEPTTVPATEAITKPATQPAAANAEPVDIEDLEDGEIDDDEDDNDVIITNATTTSSANNTGAGSSAATTAHDSSGAPHKTPFGGDAVAKIPIIDLSHEHTPSPTAVSGSSKHDSKSDAAAKSRRSKKGQPPADDYMEEVEKSLSNILNKAGVKPQLPKCLEARQQDTKDNDSPGTSHGPSRSSRRRKRKKQRDEREKEKDRKDKDKSRYMSPEAYNGAAPPVDDEDDFEMLNVVGGSPSSTPAPKYAPPAYPAYDSADESYTSYDSCDSLDGAGERGGGGGGGGGGGDNNKRRRRRNKKDRKRGRDRRARSRDDNGRGGMSEKRSRRDSNDDKHRQEPRKLELCKFYLMECCAKKDKCSYMHSDFPCKYYYLGMECPNRETCKFMHEAPLSEQLRNILLKHLETAPKEILGNFKRMSRDNAIAMMTKRNEELCKEYKVENTWSTIVNISTSSNRRGNQSAANNSTNDHHQHQNQQQQQQQQQPHSNIPSLFDIVVKPPVSLLSVDKHRKSRWADTNTREVTPPAPENSASSGAQLPSYLDLKNLEGIMKAEHIQKLTQLGITNLQEINQFTFGQLQKIGIDFVEISEVQKKVQSKMENNAAKDNEDNAPTTRDVDMRSIPSATTTTATAMDALPAIAPSTRMNINMELDSNSNNSGGVMRFEYSQYLKDSNLAFDRNDAFDDERDEEQLVIDDGNMEGEESARITTTNNESDHMHDEPPKSSDLAYRLGLPLNPFNPFRTNPADYKKSDDKLLSNSSTGTHIGYPHNEHMNASSHARRRSRSRTRSRSHSRSRSRSRSQTPIRTQSTTPEASDSADNDDGPSKGKQPVYERQTMYDFSAAQAEEDERLLSERSMKNDKDMRYLGGSILPLDGVMNYTPATEIDGSISSHLPRTYKVYEFAMPPANYADLRRSLRATTHTADPRVRRILGLPETPATTVALKRSGRKLSNTIASPEADESPKYYTPPSTLTTTPTMSERHVKERRISISKSAPATTTTTTATSRTDPRLDPRCAAASASTAAAAKANEAEKSSGGSSAGGAGNAAGDGINAEIMGLGKTMREKMQSSDWYRKLNSNMKIQYNQELARLITELRRFHQDTSPDKNFNFINCNKKIIDDILIQLGIFIDENGEVNKIESDKSEEADMSANAEARVDFMQQSDFPHPQRNMPNAGFGFPNDFRFPPPNIGGGLVMPPMPISANASGMTPRMDGASLLGLPPMPFNPFAANVGNFQASGPPQLPFSFLNFQQQPMGGGGGGPGGNFNMGGGHNRRNPHNRRNFI